MKYVRHYGVSRKNQLFEQCVPEQHQPGLGPQGAQVDEQALPVPRPERIQQAIEGQCLGVHCRFATGDSTCVDEVSVSVPLDMVNAVQAEDGVHLPEHVVEGLGDRKVEHVLEARLDGEATGLLHHPVWRG